MKTASLDSSIKTVASLSGANFGLFAGMLEQNPAMEAQIYAMLEESLFFVNGCTADIIMKEVRANKNEWNTFLFAPALADRKLLLTAVTQDKELPKEYFHDPLVGILESIPGYQLDEVIFETDHNYTNKRKELARTLHEWLTENL